jgi:hypothetical protein
MALEDSLATKPKTLPTSNLGKAKAAIAGIGYTPEEAQKVQAGFQAKEDIGIGQKAEEMRAKAGEAAAGAAGARETSRLIEQDPLTAQIKEKTEERSKPFVPTQETAKDLSNLFTLTTVIGFALGGAGKSHAQQAVSAMNGMLEGHLKGRDDLYKREKDIYEENMKALDKIISTLTSERTFNVENYKLKGTAMADERKQAAYETGATNISNLVSKTGDVATGEFLKQVVEMRNKAKESETKLYETAYKADREFALKKYEKEHPSITPEFKEVQVKKADGSTVLGSFNARTGQYVDQNGQPITDAVSATTVAAPGTGTAKSQQTAERVLQADVGNAKFNLENLYKVGKKTGKLPGASDAFLNNFKGSIISDITRYATYSTIDKGLQGNDALLLNMAYDIASAGTGGRGALSDAKVKAVAAQIPLQGEAESVKRTKWNALVQRVVEANKTLPEDKRVELPEDLVDYFQKGESTSAGQWVVKEK